MLSLPQYNYNGVVMSVISYIIIMVRIRCLFNVVTNLNGRHAPQTIVYTDTDGHDTLI